MGAVGRLEAPEAEEVIDFAIFRAISACTNSISNGALPAWVRAGSDRCTLLELSNISLYSDIQSMI